MYCIKCGVQLADTEKKCPLCDTVVYHPDLERPEAEPLYPADKMPHLPGPSKRLNGAALVLFVLVSVAGLVLDLQANGQLNWFGFMAGALVAGYVSFALPMWFRKPNPIIFVPCSFAAAILYLLYIDLATPGGWFLTFAFPVAGALCIIISTAVTLMCCLRRGKLYVLGGTVLALGGFVVLVEWLLTVTFPIPFVAWSIYPAVGLGCLGGLLLYLAISAPAREVAKRKLFF